MFAELIEELDLRSEDPDFLRELFRDLYRTIDEFLIEETEPLEVSLFDLVPGEPGTTWEDTLVAPDSDFPNRLCLRCHVAELLQDLSLDQREVIQRLYWLEQTVAEVVRDMGLSALEVEELHQAALRRLRFLWGEP